MEGMSRYLHLGNFQVHFFRDGRHNDIICVSRFPHYSNYGADRDDGQQVEKTVSPVL